MQNPYPEAVTTIAKVLLEEIQKHFPCITKRNYDSRGYSILETNAGYTAQQRAEMCIYIKLMKAGAFPEQREKFDKQPKKDDEDGMA